MPVAQIPTSTTWLAAFRERSSRHREIVVHGSEVDDHLRAAFGPSIATFQLGESGTGEHLLAAARRSQADADYIEALRLFVVEEQEHARLLALILAELRFPLRTRHWSDRVFVLLRRLHSLRTEVLVLLVAEVIALSYYAALREAIRDPALRDAFERIHADEVFHVDFHGATLPAYLSTLPVSLRWIARILWNVSVTGASIVVVLDHGRLLRGLRVSRRSFVRRVAHDRRQLDARLFG